MLVFGVTLDWKIVELAFGSKEMYECRNINFTREQAENFIAENRPAEEVQ